MSKGYVRSALWAVLFFSICCMAFVPYLRVVQSVGNYLLEMNDDR